MSEFRVVVGVFENRRQAHDAVDRLVEAGFPLDQIGFLTTEDDPVVDLTLKEEAPNEGRTAMGAAAGGAFGLLVGAALAAVPGVGQVLAAGALVGVVSGALLGAAGGGLIGALVAAGIPEEEAHIYEREFHSGRTLVTVHAPTGRDEEAITILRQTALAPEPMTAHPASRVRRAGTDINITPGSGSTFPRPS